MKRSDMEKVFISAYEGNATEAARVAGYKNPKASGFRLIRREHIKQAIAEKNSALNKELGKTEGRRLRRVSITRNDIINGLAEVGLKGESESARVSALSKLADIFRLSAKNANETEDFTGWTDEELLAWAQRREYPARLRRKSEPSASDDGTPEPPSRPVN